MVHCVYVCVYFVCACIARLFKDNYQHIHALLSCCMVIVLSSYFVTY